MDTYTVGDVALALGVSASTIRNWTEQVEFEAYLSTIATRREQYANAKERRYTKDDLTILNTIHVHKTRSNTWADIARLLDNGMRELDLPETAALVLPETRAESFQLLTIARTQITNLQMQVDELSDKLDEKEAKLLDTTKELMQERGDLYILIGQLQFILKQHDIDPDTGKKKE